MTQSSTKTILQNAVTDLKKSGILNPVKQARFLLAHIMGLREEELLIHDKKTSKADEKKLKNMVSRLEKGEPISRIMGIREFWGLPFLLSKATLDPRPDSETLIEAAIKMIPEKKKKYNVLDLGCGTGCLLLSFLHEYPKALGWGIDAAGQAVQTAQKNATALGLSDRAQFKKNNWEKKKLLSGQTEFFDVIFSNPPYISANDINGLDQNVKGFDPVLALDGGEDGLTAYRDLGQHLPRLMKKKGLVFLEIGYDQKETVKKIMTDQGLDFVQSYKDLQDIPRSLVFEKK